MHLGEMESVHNIFPTYKSDTISAINIDYNPYLSIGNKDESLLSGDAIEREHISQHKHISKSNKYGKENHSRSPLRCIISKSNDCIVESTTDSFNLFDKMTPFSVIPHYERSITPKAVFNSDTKMTKIPREDNRILERKNDSHEQIPKYLNVDNKIYLPLDNKIERLSSNSTNEIKHRLQNYQVTALESHMPLALTNYPETILSNKKPTEHQPRSPLLCIISKSTDCLIDSKIDRSEFDIDQKSKSSSDKNRFDKMISRKSNFRSETTLAPIMRDQNVFSENKKPTLENGNNNNNKELRFRKCVGIPKFPLVERFRKRMKARPSNSFRIQKSLSKKSNISLEFEIDKNTKQSSGETMLERPNSQKSKFYSETTSASVMREKNYIDENKNSLHEHEPKLTRSHGVITEKELIFKKSFVSHTFPFFERFIKIGKSRKTNHLFRRSFLGKSNNISNNTQELRTKRTSPELNDSHSYVKDKDVLPDNENIPHQEISINNICTKKSQVCNYPTQSIFYKWSPQKPIEPNSMSKPFKPISLKNSGVNCYLNSALQAISSCPSFIDSIMKLQKENNALSKLQTFTNLIEQLGSAKSSLEIYKNVIFRDWNMAGQQDSYELLVHVLNQVYGELRDEYEKNGQIELNNLNQWLNVRLPLRIVMDYEIRCCFCGMVSRTPLQSDLAFHVTIENTKETLQTLFDDYFKEDSIDGYYCDDFNCIGQQGIRVVKLSAPLPDTICIHLQRTHSKSKKVVKIKDKIKFTELIIIRKEFCRNSDDNNNPNSDKKYSLVAVIVHRGGVSFGHYICYKLCNGVWYYTSDSSVAKVTWDKVRACQAYILLYEALLEPNV